ncbi:1,2-phenylacetyl-CoA epoxidase subunit PaaC [Thalassobaculum sp.]|uniref:1,2-phenylacetyl-CoA epoxidase subunit PaaC n=1 Tax=Thalassobaculum sp. TaxID=2022740 RepID=UPI0032F039F2
MAATAPAAHPATVPGEPLFEYALRLGDNGLILGHRVSEWCGVSPVLEEDIALANVALDLIGQATLWLGLAAELEGKGRSADDLAFLRDAGGFRNLLLVEQPNGDFAQTLARQYFFDAWHHPLLAALATSSEPRIAEIAEKASKEAAYHLNRSRDLVVRLGDGTPESHGRMQRSVDDLWPYTGELFLADPVDEAMAAAGAAPALSDIRALWDAEVSATLAQATLRRPEPGYVQKGGKRGVHSEHLGFLLAEMQFLQRAYPGARW